MDSPQMRLVKQVIKVIENVYDIEGYDDKGWSTPAFYCPYCWDDRQSEDEDIRKSAYIWLGLDNTWVPEFHCMECGKQMDIFKFAKEQKIAVALLNSISHIGT